MARRSQPAEADSEAVEQLVNAGGDVQAVEGDGVGVMTQRRRWVAMAEACLGLEKLAFDDELGADAVAEPV